jgi:serine/threonine-protein kinase
MSRRDNYYHPRATHHAQRDPWSDTATIVLDDFALPDLLEEEEYLVPQPAVRAAPRVVTQPVRQVAPAQRSHRPSHVRAAARTAPANNRQLSVAPQQRTAAPARPVTPLRPVAPPRDYLEEEEEENPFKRSRAPFGVWIRATTAAAGLFGAVLFGRVLVEASKPPSALASTPLPAAETPPSEPVAAPSVANLEARDTPSVAARPPAAVAAPSPQPLAATADRARAARVKHAKPRRERTTRAIAAEKSERRTDSRTRQPKPSREVVASVEAREPKSAPEPSAARGAPATLRINSRPWSQVFIDGKWIGNTPQLGLQLPAGTHSVRLVNSEFGMTRTFTVKLAAGERVTRVETLKE